MDCFYQDEVQLYIDPANCIEACVPECPVSAIFHDTSIPEPWGSFVQLNAEMSEDLKQTGGNITERQEPKRGPGCKHN
jgi:ferredoxin